MKFGKKLRAHVEQSYEEWRPMYISYKSLKKCINPRAPDDDADSKDSDSKDNDVDAPNRSASPPSNKQSSDDDSPTPSKTRTPTSAERTVNVESVRRAEANHSIFFNQFRLEVDKVNEFFLDKQEDYIIEHRQLSEKVAEILASTAPTRHEVNHLRERLTNFHGELVLLENFSTVNYTGFRKILKKHDKKTGLNMRDVYLRTVLITPFFLSDTVRKLLLSIEESLTKLDTIRKFRRAPVRAALPLDPSPSPPSAARTPTSVRDTPPALPGPPPAPDPPQPSPSAHVVMEPPHPHAFITPHSALWPLYRDARAFGAVLAAAGTTGAPPEPPARLVDLVDRVVPDELGLTPSFLAEVRRPSHYLIAGEPTFSVGFVVLPPDTPPLQLFGAAAKRTTITRNLRGAARLRRFTPVPGGSSSTAPSDAEAPDEADDIRVELAGDGSTTGAWPAVIASSAARFVEWTPRSAVAIFYVCYPALTESCVSRFDVTPLSPPQFRVSRSAEVTELCRVLC